MKILIVDDDPGTLTSIGAGLSSYGYKVIVAEEGHHALEIIEVLAGKAEPVDLMVTDLKMPDMNDLELIRSAAKEWPGLASILMTAFGSDDVQRDAAALGCGYIEKPFTPETLLKIITEVRAQKRMASI